jgi:type VI secretion system protein ImpK
MQPEFAKFVDPIFLAALRLETRIEEQESIVVADERATIIRRFEEADSVFGRSEEWILAKYALCAWIDERLIYISWSNNEWWKENCLEKKFFGTRDCKEEFFSKGIDAEKLANKNALEVFFIAVVLGFRGFYGDSDLSYAKRITRSLGLPDTIEEWCRRVAKALHLKQGRPLIPGEIQIGGDPRALKGKQFLMASIMLSALLVALAIGCYIVFFGNVSKL